MDKLVDWKHVNNKTLQHIKEFLLENEGPFQVLFYGTRSGTDHEPMGLIQVEIETIIIEQTEIVMMSPMAELHFKKTYLYEISLPDLDFQYLAMMYDAALLDLGPGNCFSWIITILPDEGCEYDLLINSHNL